MSRRRRPHEDLSYSHWHYEYLPWLYERVGHRLHAADRDFTEFCFACREPLAIYETVRDVGQDLRDKGTRVTTRLAQRADVEAYLVAWKTERPQEVQQRIDGLSAEVRDLERAYPIVSFRVRQLHPVRTDVQCLSPAEWARLVRDLHARHWELAHRQAPAFTVAGDLLGRVRLW
jgi:hypothetical protein